MKLTLNRSATLIELMIAVALLSIVALSLSSVHLFSRYHLNTSERRAKLQNEVSYILEHMTKEISKGIGNEWVYGGGTTVLAEDTSASAVKRIRVKIDDSNPLGQYNNGDHWIGYTYTPGSDYELAYCSNFGTDVNPAAVCQATTSVLSNKVTSFDMTVPKSPGTSVSPCPSGPDSQCLTDNYVDINITACWNPADSSTFNKPDNPCVTMREAISMPSVSTN